MSLTLQKWGNSNAIRLPKKVIEELDWQTNQELDFSITNEGLILKMTKKKNIKDLFKDFEGKIEETEIDWGEVQGNEVW